MEGREAGLPLNVDGLSVSVFTLHQSVSQPTSPMTSTTWEMRMPGSTLPIFLQPPASIAVSGLRIILDQRGWPRATIAEGPACDDGDRLALYVAAEFEEPFALPPNKPGTEWIHLAKARHDLERGRVTDLSGKPGFGGNPPDFYIGDAQNVSIELAQFTQSQRRHALGLLRAVKKAVIQTPAGSFDHLRNRLVLIGFEDPRGLPPRPSDEEAIRDILETLKNTNAGSAPKTIPETLNPNGFQVLLINSPLGQGASACFPLPLLPQSELASACGFEIAASLTILIQARDTEFELARLTTEHDDPRNDILLISAGAPGGPDGFPLISDEVAVEPWIMRTLNMPKPKHLKRILLHRWSFGDVYELFPRYITLVESEIHSGGPHIVPVGKVPEWVWDAGCPCASRKAFRECHGSSANTNG